jgi:hypothetical protein
VVCFHSRAEALDLPSHNTDNGYATPDKDNLKANEPELSHGHCKF